MIDAVGELSQLTTANDAVWRSRHRRSDVKRTGDPSLGNFGDATVLRTFGLVPDNLDEL